MPLGGFRIVFTLPKASAPRSAVLLNGFDEVAKGAAQSSPRMTNTRELFFVLRVEKEGGGKGLGFPYVITMNEAVVAIQKNSLSESAFTVNFLLFSTSCTRTHRKI